MAKAREKDMALTATFQTGKKRPQLKSGNQKKKIDHWNQKVR